MFSQAKPPSLFLDQNEARRAEKIFLRPPPPLSQGLDDQPPPPPPHLVVWIRHCFPFLNIQSPMLLTVIVNIY